MNIKLNEMEIERKVETIGRAWQPKEEKRERERNRYQKH